MSSLYVDIEGLPRISKDGLQAPEVHRDGLRVRARLLQLQLDRRVGDGAAARRGCGARDAVRVQGVDVAPGENDNGLLVLFIMTN